MDKDTNEYRGERQEQELEKLLLEALESGEPTRLTKMDFEDIKKRAIARLNTKKGGA